MNGTCSKCGNYVHGLKAHERSCRGDGGAGLPTANRPTTPPMEGANMEQSPMQQPMDMSAVAEIATRAAVEASAKVANDFLSQLPGLVDKMFTARIDQIAAKYGAAAPPSGANGAPLQQPAPTAAPIGRMEQVMQIVGIAKQFGLLGNTQTTPTNALVDQLNNVADVIAAVDRIRGVTPQQGANIPPKTALEWAKWGHSMGKSGAPVP